jgi:hypothetical protein
VGFSTGTNATFVVDRTSRANVVSIVLVLFNLLIVLAQVCSSLEFDLNLGVIPSI